MNEDFSDETVKSAKLLEKFFKRSDDPENGITAAIVLQSMTTALIKKGAENNSPEQMALVLTHKVVSALMDVGALLNADIERLTEQLATLTGKVAKLEGVESHG